MSEEDFEITISEPLPSRLFFDDPLDNLKVRVLVKRVPTLLRKLKTDSLKRVALNEKKEKKKKAADEASSSTSASTSSFSSSSVDSSNPIADANHGRRPSMFTFDQSADDEKKDENEAEKDEKQDENEQDELDAMLEEQSDPVDGKHTLCDAVFDWQSKVFSPRELLTFAHQRFEANTPLERQYQDRVKEVVATYYLDQQQGNVHSGANGGSSGKKSDKKSDKKRAAIEKLNAQASQSSSSSSTAIDDANISANSVSSSSPATSAEDDESIEQLLNKNKTWNRNASLASRLDADAIEEASRSLVKGRGAFQLCSKVDDDAYISPLDTNKCILDSEDQSLNPVAKEVVELPLNKGNTTATQHMRVKSYSIVLCRAPEHDDDMLALRALKRVGKELPLVQIHAHPNGTLTVKPSMSDASSIGHWGTGHRFKLRSRVASSNALLSTFGVGATWVEEEFEYWIVNAAQPPPKRQPTPFELEMERRQLMREADLAMNRMVMNFEPPVDWGALKVLINGEIVSARGFDDDAIYIQYEVHCPPSWHVRSSSAGALPISAASIQQLLQQSQHQASIQMGAGGSGGGAGAKAHASSQIPLLVSCTQVSHAMLAPGPSASFTDSRHTRLTSGHLEGDQQRVYNFSFPLELELFADLLNGDANGDSNDTDEDGRNAAKQLRRRRRRSKNQQQQQPKSNDDNKHDGFESHQQQATDADATGSDADASGDEDESEASRRRELKAAGQILEWPRVYLQVMSVDEWGRHAAVGYAYFSLPDRPGSHTLDLQTWRPIGSISAERDRFFIGGTPHMQDIKLSGIPLEFQGSHFLNRYGFETRNSGHVHVRIHSAHVRSPQPHVLALIRTATLATVGTQLQQSNQETQQQQQSLLRQASQI